MRLHFWAAAEANGIGHAEFRAGNLAELVGVKSGNLKREIRKAVDAEMLHPDSSTKCLVLPEGWHWFGVGDKRCFHHGIRDDLRPPKRKPRKRTREPIAPVERIELPDLTDLESWDSPLEEMPEWARPALVAVNGS
jgi:hypothetical protein